MLDWLRRLVKPVDTGNFVRMVKHRLTPSAPSPEEFVSPLRQELLAQLAIKPDVGYSEHCTHCRAHKTVDTKLADIVDTKDDPQPWLQKVYESIIENTEATKENTAVTQGASTAWMPSKRVIYGLATASAALAGTTAAKLALDLYVIPWLVNILPFLIFTL